MRQVIAAVLIVSMLGPAVVGAQTQAQVQERERWERQTQGVRQNRLGWTTAGAAGGFGLGVYLGFKFFDAAIYADRKIWTTTIVTAIAGGVAGYLIGTARKQRTGRTLGKLRTQVGFNAETREEQRTRQGPYDPSAPPRTLR